METIQSFPKELVGKWWFCKYDKNGVTFIKQPSRPIGNIEYGFRWNDDKESYWHSISESAIYLIKPRCIIAMSYITNIINLDYLAEGLNEVDFYESGYYTITPHN